jgi:hypothetical protein
VPVLVFIDYPQPSGDSRRQFGYQPVNEDERAAIAAYTRVAEKRIDKRIQNLKRTVRSARVVELPGAGQLPVSDPRSQSSIRNAQVYHDLEMERPTLLQLLTASAMDSSGYRGTNVTRPLCSSHSCTETAPAFREERPTDEKSAYGE